MTRHDMPPTSGRGLLDADIDYSDDGLLVPPPRRFGRLALWVVSASALAVGVAGTVAYRVWFDHEQNAYVEALSSARTTLGMSQTTLAQASYGTVDAPRGNPPDAVEAVTPVAPTTLASADTPPTTAPLVLPAAPGRAGTPAVAANRAQQTAQSKANRAQTTQNTAQNRRHTTPRAKPNESLFARMGSFFHRVSYRQNVNGSQRDEYSRP